MKIISKLEDLDNVIPNNTFILDECIDIISQFDELKIFQTTLHYIQDTLQELEFQMNTSHHILKINNDAKEKYLSFIHYNSEFIFSMNSLQEKIFQFYSQLSFYQETIFILDCFRDSLSRILERNIPQHALQLNLAVDLHSELNNLNKKGNEIIECISQIKNIDTKMKLLQSLKTNFTYAKEWQNHFKRQMKQKEIHPEPDLKKNMQIKVMAALEYFEIQFQKEPFQIDMKLLKVKLSEINYTHYIDKLKADDLNNPEMVDLFRHYNILTQYLSHAPASI